MFRLFRRPPQNAKPELARAVALAFQLARQTGRAVSLSAEPGPRCISPSMGGRMRFGFPPGLPTPAGMLDPRWVQHPRALMVSPWATATEGMWFLQDDHGPLCMHLSAKGILRFLRFQPCRREWMEA